MQKLRMFNQVTLDGYFADEKGGMAWAHRSRADPEWDAFVKGNASGGGTLLFGRVTYEMMASYWPTPAAAQNDPVVAKRMNDGKKVVFSRTLHTSPWANTRILNGDIASEVRKLKSEKGEGIAILGSGSITTQLTKEGLIDEYQFVVYPVMLGKGRQLFAGLDKQLELEQTGSRSFANGNVVLTYERTK